MGEQVLVLRIIIEEFGGEATGDNLCRRLIAKVPSVCWNEPQSRVWIRGVLGELADCGALALEDLDGSEVIARVTLDGVIFAYEQPEAKIASAIAKPNPERSLQKGKNHYNTSEHPA